MHGKGEAPAIRILEEAGEDVGRLEYRFVERGGTKDAARQLGLCEHDIVKSLVFDDGKGGQAVMGLPGCVMYAERTIFDLVLPRVLADDPVTKEEIATLGEGGLCLNCPVCTYPNCGFGK